MFDKKNALPTRKHAPNHYKTLKEQSSPRAALNESALTFGCLSTTYPFCGTTQHSAKTQEQGKGPEWLGAGTLLPQGPPPGARGWHPTTRAKACTACATEPGRGRVRLRPRLYQFPHRNSPDNHAKHKRHRATAVSKGERAPLRWRCHRTLRLRNCRLHVTGLSVLPCRAKLQPRH